MTEQTENATRLARPIIRLAKLVGIATSYVGMSRDYHEIEDDVLVAVLKALGIDASNDGAIEQSITTIQRERDTRIVPPTVLHVVGKESKVEVHGGALDVPEASIMLEDGGAYAGKIELEGGSDTVVEVDGGFVCTSYLVLPADLPEGYHTLEVTVGGKTEIATVISAPEKIELLDDMKEGSLWGWMSQLYSIRSSGSWGIGDYELSFINLAYNTEGINPGMQISRSGVSKDYDAASGEGNLYFINAVPAAGLADGDLDPSFVIEIPEATISNATYLYINFGLWGRANYGKGNLVMDVVYSDGTTQSVTPSLNSASTWQYFENRIEVPAGVTSAAVKFYALDKAEFMGSESAASNFRIDDVNISVRSK